MCYNTFQPTGEFHSVIQLLKNIRKSYQFKDGDKLVTVEDALTSGKALQESMEKIKKAANANVTDMIISVDRMEIGKTHLSAVMEAEMEYGIRVHSIVTFDDIITAIENGVVPGMEHLEKMKQYREEYGVKAK